jgi:hypothetical protein
VPQASALWQALLRPPQTRLKGCAASQQAWRVAEVQVNSELEDVCPRFVLPAVSQKLLAIIFKSYKHDKIKLYSLNKIYNVYSYKI